MANIQPALAAGYQTRESLSPCPPGFLPKGAKLIPIYRVVESQYKPRDYLNTLDLRESIEIHGIRNPLTVCQRAVCSRGQPIYEIIDGHRRKAVAVQLNFDEVPIIIIDDVTRSQLLEHQLATHRQNCDLSVIEEARAILSLLALRLDLPEMKVKKLLSRLGHEQRGDGSNVTPQEREVINQVLEAAGRKLQDFRTNLLPFLSYKPDVQEAFSKGFIGRCHARVLGNVANDDLRGELLYEAASNGLTTYELRARLEAAEGKPVSDEEICLLQRHVEMLFNSLKHSDLWKSYRELAQLQNQLEKLDCQYAVTTER